ncbi:MAG TPA: ThuA domain-containing protein [Phycisphaerae bacterium]|nr:ThuA domain-containing protein [Phycisphaerae bacterium]
MSLVALTVLLVAPGCAPPPPPHFRVLMVTHSGPDGARPEPWPWQEWRSLKTPARTRLLNTPAFRLADQLMDRGDMVIDIAAHPQNLKPDKIDGYNAVLVDLRPGPATWPSGPRVLTRAVHRGAGLVALGDSSAAFENDPDWHALIGAATSPPSQAGPAPLAVLDPRHPTTLNLGTCWDVAEPLRTVPALTPDARILIRTARALTGRQAFEPVAWTRQIGRGRVFVLTFGHEPLVRDRLDFVTVTHNAIRWTGRLVEERCNQLTLGERKAGFTLLFDADRPRSAGRGWSLSSGELVGRLHETSEESLLVGFTSASPSELRFEFMPVKGRASLRLGHRTGATTTAVTSLPLNHDLPAEAGKTLWPDGWHAAQVRVGDKTTRLWIDGLPAGRLPVGSKDLAGPASLSWSLSGGPGSELRLRHVRCREAMESRPETMSTSCAFRKF